MPERRFEQKLVAHTEQRRRLLEEAGGTPLIPRAYFEILEDYLLISRRRAKSQLPLFNLQLTLLDLLSTHEQAVSHYKNEKKRLERQLRTPDEASDLDADLKTVTRELYVNRAICRAIRDISDGIAWRLFDHDRAILHYLADRPGRPHIDVGGIESELREFGRVFNEEDGIAILNDMTHFLKVGDVTVIKEAGDVIEFIEVKRGHRTSGRITRQRQEMRETVEFLSTGLREHGGSQLQIVDLDIAPQHFFPHVRRVLDAAGRNGSALERIGDHLVVYCLDSLRISGESDLDRALSTIDEAGEVAVRWQDEGDMVVPFSSLDKYLQVRWYAPFAIYPFDDLQCVKLAAGGLILNAYVNASAVLRYIDQRGWRTIGTVWESTSTDHESPNHVAMVQKEAMTSTISPLEFGRLGYEFLRPRTLVDKLEALLALGPTGSDYIQPRLRREREVWR